MWRRERGLRRIRRGRRRRRRGARRSANWRWTLKAGASSVRCGRGEIFAEEALGEVGRAMEVGEDGGGVDEDGAGGEEARPDWMAATALSGWLRRW